MVFKGWDNGRSKKNLAHLETYLILEILGLTNMLSHRPKEDSHPNHYLVTIY